MKRRAATAIGPGSAQILFSFSTEESCGGWRIIDGGGHWFGVVVNSDVCETCDGYKN